MAELARARDRGRARRAGRLPPRAVHEDLPRLDGVDPPVVRLAAALVGAPDPGLVLPGRAPDRGRDRSPRRAPSAAPPSSRRTRTSSTRGSPRSSGRSRRSAGRTTRPSSARWYPNDVELDRPRDHLPLGGADDHGRARAHGRDPVPHGQHPLDDQRARRPPDVEEPRHRHRPVGADRAARRRRDALRAA